MKKMRNFGYQNYDRHSSMWLFIIRKIKTSLGREINGDRVSIPTTIVEDSDSEGWDYKDF